MCSNNALYQEIISANAKYKEHVAAVYYDGDNLIKLKYHEVYIISNIIYENLKYLNQKRICFGLLMEHNIYIPSFIISIQKLNCAFMFLDAKQQIDFFSSTDVHYILEYNSETVIKNADLLFSILLNFNSLEICNVYQVKSTLKIYKNINYVIKTSGTTNMQKTVIVEHQCIASNIFSLRKKLVVSDKDVIYFGTSLTFDPSVVELYLALITGACLFIVSQKIKQNPQLLYKILFEEDVVQITFLQMCPSIFMQWNLQNVQNIFQNTKLRILLLGGERFPINLQTIERSNQLRIFNIYGITEISCWGMIAEIIPNEEITLGEVLDDTFVEVRNIDGKIITEGEGELFIGSFERICYLNNEEPEALKKPVIRATGDRVMIKDNKIIYKGRTNDIIKRFGNRVNTQFIENLVYEQTNLRNICIWLQTEYKLILFVLIPNSNKGNNTKIIDKLRVKLLHALPKECMPDHIELLERIPLTINGKVDKRKLCQKANTIFRCNRPTSHLLEIFEQLWCKYFGNKIEITGNGTFYELGGTSITAMQFSEEFRQRYELILPASIFDYIFTNEYNDVRIFLSNFENKMRKRNNSDTIDSASKILKQNQQLSMKIKWKYNLQGCVDTIPVPSPNKSFIAVGSFSNIFSILNSDTGAEIRKIVFPNAIESPCLVSKCGNFIYIGCFDHKMYCIEVCTGNTIWAYKTGDYIKNRPCFIDQDSAIIFGSYDKYLYCVNAKTGSLRWKLYVDGGITSDGLLINTSIIIVTIRGVCICLKENGSIIWRVQLDNPVFSSPTMLFKNQFVLPDVLGTLYCLNCNGEKLWEYQTTAGNIYSSICFYENLLIFGSHAGVIYCLDYKEEDLKPALKNQIPINSATSSTISILIHNSKTYIVAACVTGYVYLIDISNFSVESNLKLNGDVFSSPIVIQNNIFIGCRDNNLICIEVH